MLRRLHTLTLDAYSMAHVTRGRQTARAEVLQVLSLIFDDLYKLYLNTFVVKPALSMRVG
jgi:hypothetical protein